MKGFKGSFGENYRIEIEKAVRIESIYDFSFGFCGIMKAVKIECALYILNNFESRFEMTSERKRTAEEDTLISPDNAVLVIIDYQPVQIHSVNTDNTGRMLKNLVTLCKAADVFELPVVLTTVNVGSNRNQDTLKQIKDALPENTPSIDRTTMNSWEDEEFVNAVKATGRKKIIMCALWTEVCMAFPTIDALKEGFEVFPVVDAIAGTTPLTHETALRRVEQAGASLVSTAQLICELQRDWNREETVKEFVDLMFEVGAFQGL